MLFGEPARWIALLLEAMRLGARQEVEQSQAMRATAFEEAPATAGSIDGRPFEWIADADTRLGPVLEAIVNGSYYWVPFQRIKTLVLEAPADLRDLVWTPGHITWANQGETVALIPTRYPGSESSDDSGIRLARTTTWADQGCEVYLGLGQRMLATDAGEFPLLETRRIELETAPAVKEET